MRLLESQAMPPGSSARVQLRLTDRIAAVPGDRFIVRRLSPVQTIGGGVVLDPLPAAARGRLNAAETAALDRFEAGGLPERLEIWVAAARERGVSEDQLAQRAGIAASAVRAALSPAVSDRRIHALRRSPDRYLSESALAGLASRAGILLQGLLAADAAAVGVSRSTLLQRLLPGADARWAEAVETALAARGAVVITGEEVRAPGREDLAMPERELSERIAALFRERGLDPPAPAEVADALRRHPKVVDGLIGYLVKKGSLVRLPGGWIVAREAVDAVVARLREQDRPSLDVSEFKTLFGSDASARDSATGAPGRGESDAARRRPARDREGELVQLRPLPTTDFFRVRWPAAARRSV